MHQDISGWQRLEPHPSFAQTRRADAWPDCTVWQEAAAIARKDPDRVSHVFEDQVHRVGDLLRDAEALAASLYDRGLRAGDAVAFQLPNWAEVVVIDLAAALAGWVLVPIIPIYRDAEVSYMLRDCRAKAMIVMGEYRGFDYLAMVERIRSSLPDLSLIVPVRQPVAGGEAYESLIASGRPFAEGPVVDADAIKMLLYTSGTTGQPKGVLHSHNTAAYTVRVAMQHWRLGEGDALLMASPVTHVTGFSAGVELPWHCGMRTVVMERWDAARGIELIEREQVSASIGATPFLHELLSEAQQRGSHLPSLRTYACGGAAVPPNLIAAANEQFENLRAFRVFGASEVPLVTLGFVAAEAAAQAATTDGQVVHYEVRVTDDDGRPQPPGSEGEICVRGPGMFLGYADVAQTRDCIDAEGFFMTGDLGVIDAQRAITITGRKKDLINRGGEKISAKEIEDILHRHPAVGEAAVVAMPHARLGETVCAYVIAKPGQAPSTQALIEHVLASGVARQKCPEQVLVVETLPRTASGKVRKDLLRTDIRQRLVQSTNS